MMPPSIPDRVDPYEVSYMRGGQNELTRVVIVSLVEQGYLELQAANSGFLGSLFGSSEQHVVAFVNFLAVEAQAGRAQLHDPQMYVVGTIRGFGPSPISPPPLPRPAVP